MIIDLNIFYYSLNFFSTKIIKRNVKIFLKIRCGKKDLPASTKDFTRITKCLFKIMKIIVLAEDILAVQSQYFLRVN